jgi:hypothetical protein
MLRIGPPYELAAPRQLFRHRFYQSGSVKGIPYGPKTLQAQVVVLVPFDPSLVLKLGGTPFAPCTQTVVFYYFHNHKGLPFSPWLNTGLQPIVYRQQNQND